MQRVEQHVGRGHRVIEQTDLPQVEVLREMEAEAIILECVGDQVDELDLVAHRDPRLAVGQLLAREARAFQERIKLKSFGTGSREG